VSEDAWNDKITELTNAHQEVLEKCGVRRVSILICRRATYPMYFTLREIDGSWKEERGVYRVEPALAFQLELSRLSNYNLTPIFAQNKQLHIYHGVARENQLDNRFFICGLVRPGRVRGGISMAKYLISETDRLVTSILDSLEVVSVKHRNADCNHIFINSIYNLPVTFGCFGGQSVHSRNFIHRDIKLDNLPTGIRERGS
jgi:acetyl-CoA carboxylase/biotin carboxylase 1